MFAYLSFGEQNVPRCQIAVHKLDVGQVGHSVADLPREGQYLARGDLSYVRFVVVLGDGVGVVQDVAGRQAGVFGFEVAAPSQVVPQGSVLGELDD